MMGMAGEQVIVGFLIYEITRSTAWVGVSLAIYFGPMLVFGAPAGVLADRIERRRLLPVFELALVMLLGYYAYLSWDTATTTTSLLMVTFISGSFRAIHSPIRLSYVYDLVGADNIVPSLGLMNLSIRTGQLIGASLAGIVLYNHGPGPAFLILCIGHLFAFLLLTNLNNAGRSEGFVPMTLTKQFSEYWNELSQNQSLKLVITLTAAIEIFGFSFITTLPELAKYKLETDATGLGFMHTARAAGGMLAGIAFASALKLSSKGKLYLALSFGFGLFVAGLGLSPNYTLAVIAIAAIAAMAASTDVLSQSMMQLLVPDRLRGRAMGVWVFAIGIAPIGHIQAGILSSWLGADTALVINGALLMLTITVVTVFAPKKFKNI